MPPLDFSKIELILGKVTKPARYMGSEWNVVKKNFDSCSVKIALCFPDVYEIGMSHLGFKILYHLLNEQPDVVCERVFAPWTDMQDILRQEGIPIFSLESKRPLTDFNMIGFSLGHELNYTNILGILSLAGIPFKASERGNDFPVIIGGGVGSFNPEPIAEFFDAFFVGEAEEGILEIVDVLRRHCEEPRRGDEAISLERGDCFASLRSARNDVLKELTRIEGVYVPSFYEVTYNDDGTIKKFSPKDNAVPAVIKKRIVKDFENSYYPVKQLVPFIQIVHDRISLEVMRGCPNRCNFCQASSIYWPCRLRSVDKILEIAEAAYQATGYEEISLVSLSTGDHPKIMEIVRDLAGRFSSRKVSISFPSLRAEDMVCRLPGMISSVKKTGLTFAPEAGSQRLRDLLNKRLDINKLFSCITEAARSGWRHIKVYFMIGLPTETEEDLTEIAQLLRKISASDKLSGKAHICVTASISTFVPKPHTKFEYEPMISISAIKEKQAFLSKTARIKGVDLKWHDPYISYLEGTLSRGDRRLSQVIFNAYSAGARFDSWRECFNFAIWQKAFEDAGLSPDFYLYRRKSKDEILPWAHIDCCCPN